MTIACALTLLLPSVSCAEEKITPDTALERAIAGGVPGISAAIATRDGIVWSGVAGMSDKVHHIPVRKDQLFGIGSITKTFVAVVILQLAEEKKLDLNSTPAALLGDAVADIPNADSATLLQLLNHTSGIYSWEDDSAWIREGRGAEMDVGRWWGKADTLKYIKSAKHAPTNAPGAAFSYSNSNHTILGLIIEKVTGNTAEAEIRRRILQPLGLKNIYMDGFEAIPRDRIAGNYHAATDEFVKTAGVNAAFPEVAPGMIETSKANLSVEWTAGGLVSTAGDLALYARALRDGKLLKPASMAILKDLGPFGYGHSLSTLKGTKELIYGHSGGVLGFSARMYWLADKDLVMVVLMNIGAMHSGEQDPAVIFERDYFRNIFLPAATHYVETHK